MAKLAIVGSYSVNGVAKLHTDILKEEVFRDFYQLDPQKFIAITNGVTHRRFLAKANPRLAELITDHIGDGWVKEPQQLEKLKEYAGDRKVQQALLEIRLQNKKKIWQIILKKKYRIKN